MSVKINNAVLSKLENQFEFGLDLSAQLLVDDMKKTAGGDYGQYLKAVDTANYLNNFDWRKVRNFLRTVFNDTEYALPIEFGTTKMRPRPIMRTVAVSNGDKITAIFKRVVNV